METVLSLDEQQSEANVETPEPQTEKPQQPKKGNWNADEMLIQHFEQPVRFVTYTGIKELSVVKTKKYTV